MKMSLRRSARPISKLVSAPRRLWEIYAHDSLYASVAIAYLMQKTPCVFPIIGGRKVEHLYANIAALDVDLSAEHVKKIEAASPFDKGMMYNLFVRPAHSLRTVVYDC